MKNIKSQLKAAKEQREFFEKTEQAAIKVANLEIEKAALKAAIKVAKDLGLSEVASEKELTLNAVLKEQEETKSLMKMEAPQPQEQQQLNLQQQPQDAESIVNAFLNLDINEAQLALKKLSDKEQEKEKQYIEELDNIENVVECMLVEIKNNPEYKQGDEQNNPEYLLSASKEATLRKAISCSQDKQCFYEVISKNIDNPLEKLTAEIIETAIKELEKSPDLTIENQEMYADKLSKLDEVFSVTTLPLAERIEAAKQMKPAMQKAANIGLILSPCHEAYIKSTVKAEQLLKENNQ